MNEEIKAMIDKMVENLNDMAWSDYHINLGAERKARAVEKEDRIVLRIDCYTLHGKYKGNYKAGYYDLKNERYVVGQYDDINAETSEWLK